MQCSKTAVVYMERRCGPNGLLGVEPWAGLAPARRSSFFKVHVTVTASQPLFTYMFL